MLGGAGSPGGDDLLTVTIVRDDQGYGMKVSGDNPVYVQSVKEHGAAWRAGLRAGDRILRVDSIPVLHHSHQQVVLMIRANPTTVLTVQQNASRHKTPITAPVPVNSEKQRQLEVSKVHTVRLMLEQEQKYIRDLRNELLKVPDVRKQAELESAEQRCAKLQYEIDSIMAGQPSDIGPAPSTPRLNRPKPTMDKSPIQNTGFLSGLPRSLSNLTGQSLRNLRQARQNKMQQENQPPLVRQNSDESNNKRRHVHNNTVPMVPTTCLDNVTPPPLPPRSIERPKRNPLSPSMSPPINPLAKPKPCNSASPAHKQYYKGRYDRPYPMHQSMPAYNDNQRQFRRSSHSLDGELDGPQPNSIAMQMSYPLVNAPPPPLQTDNRTSVPVLHMRSRSSPEQLDHDLCRSSISSPGVQACVPPERDTPPPGTPPPPYHTNTQPCADSQRAIISMEEDDSPASDSSTYSGLFSNLRCVRESNARTAVLLNWLLGERRSPCACLVLVLTDGYRGAAVPLATRRRWAYEIHSTFLMPNAVLQLNGVDENMANEIEHVLVNEHDKEELLCNVFRKARQKAKDELGQQLSEFQVKRQVGLGTLYGPDDAQLERCMLDKAQELVVVEQLLCARLRAVAGSQAAEGAAAALLAALAAAALCLQARPVAVAAAVGASRASFLQRDKLYKQRVKSITKQHQQPFVVRGHHLQLQALTSVGHCHHCDNVIWGLAPQAYVCTDCKLRVHRGCARNVEEGCCLDGEHHNNRISRLIERIHPPLGQDTNEKKPKKPAAGFLNMDRSFRKTDDESWEKCNTAPAQDRRDESDESLYESADGHSDAISASDDALPRLKTPTISKESLKLAITDEEVEQRTKKGHRKTMSLSNPLEIVKNLGDEWFEAAKHHDKFSDKKKSRESLWSEEDRDSIHGSTMKLDQTRKNSKKEDKSLSNSRKSSTTEAPKRKSSKGSSVSALNFLRRKKTPTSAKPVETVSEDVVDKCGTTDEILNFTKLFLEGEKRHASISASPPPVETDSDDDEPPTPKQLAEHRRRLSRQTSRSKSKARGKSQSLKVNTLRKSHSGTLKKGKKKSIKTPSAGRSRQASIVEQTPMVKKKNLDNMIHNSWLFSSGKGEPRREGSSEEPLAADVDGDTSDVNTKEPDKDTHWRSAASSGRGVNRAESCRERDAPRRGKHRNASDPNRLTAHNNHDLEPGATTAPSGSSSSSSLSSRSNESNTVAAEQHASQSDFSDEDEPALATQWADSLPPHVLESLELSSRLRKRQDVIHELIVTERSHVRWLKVLDLVFLRGLAAGGGLLPRDELAALFPNLPAVRERHARLLLALRQARADAADHLVKVAPVATALLNTLGEPGYATCLSRFCRGQRTALEALRGRRRKNKDLHQFLAAREQLPLCGRLQLRDLLPTVWQRLTKYQLLLEGILKTCEVSEGGGGGGGGGGSEEEEAGLVRRALGVARDVLHRVDAAIRNHENDCRLRTIQSKLEIRVPNAEPEWEELRRLELPQHALRMEGDLAIRNESNKKINVLALLLEDCLVLLQREGDKFVLKPIAQNLLPLIKWNKVLFRPNAAVRNSFFLMSINKFQMYELSANTAQEYATWSRHIQEAPLAQLTELKAAAHHHARSTDDSGINVSRNPSDASEKSSSVGDEPELPPTQLDRSSADSEPVDRDTHGDQDTHGEEDTHGEQNPQVEQDTPAEQDIVGDRGDSEKRSVEKEELSERDDKPKGRRPTVGRVSTHSGGPRAELAVTEAAATLAHTAARAFTPQERLRQLDQVIARALRAKSAVVGELLGVPSHSYAHVADMAVADTLGQVDSGVGQPPCEPDVHQLLLAAHTQVSQLTTTLQRALSVNEAGAVAARTPLGRCRTCRRRTMPSRSETTTIDESFEHVEHPPSEERAVEGILPSIEGILPSIERDSSLDLLTELEGAADDGYTEGDAEGPLESNRSAAELAMSLVSPARGVQSALSALLAALPPALARSAALRASLAAHRDHRDAQDFQSSQEIMPKGGQHPTIQDQPSNGG